MKKILSIILCFALTFCFAGCGGDNPALSWSEIKMGNIVPEPDCPIEEISINTEISLWFSFKANDSSIYSSYINTCKSAGFTIDPEDSASSYIAYNSDGYKINVSYMEHRDEVVVIVDAPIKMTSLSWPTIGAGSLVPVPNAEKGNISSDSESFFFAYIADVSTDDFANYIESCIHAGFAIGYNRGDDFYFADNSDGTHLALDLIGFNIMTVSVRVEKNADQSPDGDGSSNIENNGSVSADFKKTMDEYEEFFDQYIAIMKKYQSNPTDPTILSDYTDYLTEYADVMESMNEMGNKNLNAAELQYYLEVTARINKKLVDSAQ